MGNSAPCEPMLTMVPRLPVSGRTACEDMMAAACWDAVRAASTFTAKTSRHVSRETSSTSSRWVTPATLTSTSSRCHRSRAAPTSRATCSGCVTSHSIAAAHSPSSAASASSASPRRSPSTTRAPAPTNSPATARPIAPAAPVTTAT